MYRLVELFLALRFLKPKRSYVSVITILSLLGVFFGVGVLIVVISVMEGFEREFEDKIVGFNAHISVQNGGILTEEEMKKVREVLKGVPEVRAMTPFVIGPVLAECNERITTPFVRGLDPKSSEEVISLKKYLVGGEWFLGPNAILVGQEWARNHDAWVGDKVTLLTPKDLLRKTRTLKELYQPNENTPRTVPLPEEYIISGVFSTGYQDYDNSFFVVNLESAKQLYSLGDGVHGIDLRIDNPMDAMAVRTEINKELKFPLHAYSWMDQNRQKLEAIAVERTVVMCLLFFVMVVAAFGICSTLITVTVQKTGEIGLMKAVGATDGQILRVFTLYGFVVGMVGSVLGMTAAVAILLNRNELLGWLREHTGIEIFPAAVYGFSRLPAVLDPWLMVGVALSGLALSTFAALLPAFTASRVDPAAALRNYS